MTMPWPISNGSANAPATISACRRKPSGNGPPAPAPRPRGTGVMDATRRCVTLRWPAGRCNRRWGRRSMLNDSFPAIPDMRSPPRWATSCLTRLAYTMCSGMRGSGVPIGGLNRSDLCRVTERQIQPGVVLSVSSAAVPGTAIRGTCARPGAAGSSPASGTATSVSGWPGRSRRERYLLSHYFFTSFFLRGKSRRGTLPPSGREATESIFFGISAARRPPPARPALPWKRCIASCYGWSRRWKNSRAARNSCSATGCGTPRWMCWNRWSRRLTPTPVAVHPHHGLNVRQNNLT